MSKSITALWLKFSTYESIIMNNKNVLTIPQISIIRKNCLTVNKRSYCLSMQVGSLSEVAKIRLNTSNNRSMPNSMLNIYGVHIYLINFSRQLCLTRMKGLPLKLRIVLQKGQSKDYKLPTHWAQIEWWLEQIFICCFVNKL